ncbi:hypothetical protein OIV83_006255 [Microbotryomycetes sp. JL201]|nr:hypothetical protein OIV83_006255 [Microbotryomycetes sp. JL201]
MPSSSRTAVSRPRAARASTSAPGASRRTAAQSDTRDSASLYASGVAAYRTGSYDTACELLSEAIELDKTQPRYFDARCLALGKLGRTKDAFMDARLVVKLEPDSYKGYHKAGNLFAKIGNWERAERMLEQALTKLKPQEDAKMNGITAQLQDVRKKKAQASFCPLANLPTEIFAEIIAYAVNDVTDYTSTPRPWKGRGKLSTFSAVQGVCKSWRHAIASNKRFWTVLCLDGEINGKNALLKARLWEARARSDPFGSHQSSAITRLVLTAMTLVTPLQAEDWIDYLDGTAIFSGLSEVTISTVDSPQRAELEAAHLQRWLEHLVEKSPNLRRLTICSANRLGAEFQARSAFVAFPLLRSFRVFGKTSGGVTGGIPIRCEPFQRLDSQEEAQAHLAYPTNAEELVWCGVISAQDQHSRLCDFPRLRTLDIEMLGVNLIWELLSAPDLERFHVVLYGETRIAALDLPDLEKSWRLVKSLRLGGANRFAPRLLARAVEINTTFRHLTMLDLAWVALTQKALDLFCTDNAPLLSDVSLTGTTAVPTGASLTLPPMSACRRLNISSTLWTKDLDIQVVSEHSPKLEELVASWAIELTGRPLMQLVKNRQDVADDGTPLKLSSITLLNVTGCNRIDDVAIDWLRRHIKPGGFVYKFQ